MGLHEENYSVNDNQLTTSTIKFMANREIKFRAWDKEAKKFFESEPRINAMTISITLNGEIIGHPNVGEITSHYELMQFTGLKDKNEKEIYQGDIVRCRWMIHGKPSEIPFNAEIMFNESIGAYQISYRNVDGRFVSDQIYFRYQIEVIGNIYENKELL